MRLLLASCEELPEGALDTPFLVPALQAAGFEVSLQAWNRADPAEFDHCLLHTVWDYSWRPKEFDAWLQRCEGRVTNSFELSCWNAHKGYLAELEAAGVPVVPCVTVRRGQSIDLAGTAQAKGWPELVVKPAIGQTAREAMRAKSTDLAALQRHAERLLEAEDILVQLFLPSITSAGERSLILIDAELTHALEKRAAPGDWRVQDDHGGTVHEHRATAAELAVAKAALAATPGDPLYARVDLVQHAQAPCVIELELIEPELFLRLEPRAATLLAEALRARLSESD